MSTWTSETQPEERSIGPGGWLRAFLRAVPLAFVTFGSLGMLLLLRLIERPLCGVNRPITPFITQFVCKSAFVILGMRHSVHGQPMRARGAAVANHSSWLDVFALNAPKRIYFVSKSEVAGWPGIGWLARATGTVFITRRKADAKRQEAIFQERLVAGHRLMFFPEGTSTDGLRILPFKSTLFQAFFTSTALRDLHIQPVTVTYQAPPGEDPRFYGWWGEMEFAHHLIKTLAARRQGAVDIQYHPPLKVGDFADRKALAAALESRVRGGMPTPQD